MNTNRKGQESVKNVGGSSDDPPSLKRHSSRISLAPLDIEAALAAAIATGPITDPNLRASKKKTPPRE
jgi:hypothetical protein